MAGSHYFVVFSLLLCLVVLSQGVKHHEFCIPATWFSDVEVEEIVNDEGSVQTVSFVGEYYFDVPQYHALKVNLFYPSQNLNISVLELYDQMLVFEWFEGVCQVTKLNPEAVLTNCYETDEDPKGPIYIGGSLSSYLYGLDEPNVSATVLVSQGTYIPILERTIVNEEFLSFFALAQYYNLETSPHFDATTFTPPSYCQAAAETSSSHPRRMDVLHHFVPVPFRRA